MEMIIFTDLDMKEFGSRLTRARHIAGLKQWQVVQRADLNPGNYSALESAKAKGLRVTTLYRLCQVLGVSADYLLGLSVKEHSQAGGGRPVAATRAGG